MSTIFSSGQSEPSSLTGLVRELFVRFGTLVRTQIELTKTEVKVEGRKLAMAGLFGFLAITVGSIFLMLLAFSILLLLAQTLQLVWAVVITTGIFLILTATLAGLTVWEIKRNSAYMDV